MLELEDKRAVGQSKKKKDAEMYAARRMLDGNYLMGNNYCPPDISAPVLNRGTKPSEKGVEGQKDESQHQQHHQHGQGLQGAETEGQTSSRGLVEEGPHQHHQDPEGPELGAEGQAREPVSCVTSMLVWMPSPIAWASEGGSCPRTPSKLIVTNINCIEEVEPGPVAEEEAKEDNKEAKREDNIITTNKGKTSQETEDSLLVQQGDNGGEEDQHQHHHGDAGQGLGQHHQGEEERRNVSCVTSMPEWMPSPIIWASEGGESPRTPVILASSNDIPIEAPKLEAEPEKREDKDIKEDKEEECRPSWIKDAGDEENERYRKFLA